jgi:hypothetical protein
MNRTFNNSSMRLLLDSMSAVSCMLRLVSPPVGCVILAGMLLMLAGCGATEQASDLPEAPHLEHFVPAHKPKDFSSLVDQLALRFPQLGSAGSNADPNNQAENAQQELADIIGWIPELAADSELKKADFESAVAAANKLAKFFEELRPQQMRRPSMLAVFRTHDQRTASVGSQISISSGADVTWPK